MGILRKIGFDGGLACLCLSLTMAAPSLAVAAEATPQNAGTRSFLGVEIQPFHALYIVSTAVNIRAEPDQNSKKVGTLEEGERIVSVGRAEKNWVAYRKQGQDLGFVYEPALYPIIDSTLTRPITGTASRDGFPDCTYKVTFVGKSEAEGQIFLIGDYEVDWVCEQNATKAVFTTPMFLTEGPYVSKSPSVHQVTIDILDLAINLEEVLSTNLLYDHEKMHVVYDSMSSTRLVRNTTSSQAFVTSLTEALQASVKLAYDAWDETLWGELMKRRE